MLLENEKVFIKTKCEPETYQTAGGLSVLIFNRQHLHFKRRNATAQTASGATCLKNEYHVPYYYADIALLQLGEVIKVLKCAALAQGSCIHSDDLPEFLDLINHASITKQTLQLT